jgi:hypothetical protein
MHDRLDHHRMNEEASLAAALRALPAATPKQDAWPALAARIRRRQAVRRTIKLALPTALAAGIALAFAWPHVHFHAPAPVRIARPAASTPAHAIPDIARLQASSRQWQAWVQNLDHNGAPLDGQRLARAVALQDRIGLIDLQLSASRDAATLSDLWQQRIALLQQLGLLHLQAYRVAEQAPPGHAHAISM